MVRLASVLLLCAACFTDNPPVLGTGGSSGGASSSGGATGAVTSGEVSTSGSPGTGTGTGSGAGSTTGGESTGTSTGGVATTTTGDASATGSTGVIGSTSGDASTGGSTTGMSFGCEDAASEQECVGCCSNAVKASSVYYAALGLCLCKQGSPCQQACAGSLCLGLPASNNCVACAGADGAMCAPFAVSECQADEACAEFLACVDASGCAGKP